MDNVKEKVSLITTLLDTQKTPGDVTVSTIHKLGDKNLKQGCRNLFDAGQALGAAKLAGAGIVVYLVAKTGKWIVKKVRRGGETIVEEDDPEIHAAIQCAQKLDREEMLKEEKNQGCDTFNCEEMTLP